ncbi:TPA: DUF1642 domain-containing protein [Listeria monocytogenes]
MKFKKGDKVQFIREGSMVEGVVKEVKDCSPDMWYLIDDKCKDCWIFGGHLILLTPLPVIPQFVADWISRHKQEGYNLIWSISYENNDMPDEIYEWLTSAADNQELFARAWLDGYEVEKEPLYYVRLPLSTWNDDAAELEVINMYVLLNKQSDETTFTGLIINKNKKWTTKLTEAEIKGMPGGDIYWQFAVLVEELEE